MDKERRDYIHRDAKIADDMGLPFEITKPKKEVVRDIIWCCKRCGKTLFVGRDTYLVVCGSCATINKKGE